jgi:hypothetical protein
MGRGTFFTANFPLYEIRPPERITNVVNYILIMTTLTTGSGGVKHGEMTSEDTISGKVRG